MTHEQAARRRIIYLSVSALALLFLGLLLAWSIFSAQLDSAYPEWGRSALALTFSISIIMFCIGGLMGSYVMRRLSLRIALILAAVLMCVGFILTALTADFGIHAVYACYGVLCGMGCGVGYNVIISVVNQWFPDRVGFSSGLLLLGFGLGALLLGSLTDICMTAFGWKVVFYALAFAALVLLGSMSLFLKNPPLNIEELFPKRARGNKDQGGNTSVCRPSVTPARMLTSMVFILYLVWFTICAGTGLTLIGESKQGAMSLGVDAGFATLLVGLVGTCNGFGRIIMGIFFDRFGMVRSLLTITCSLLFATALVIGGFYFDSGIPFIAGALIMGLSYGGVIVMSSSFAMERFGPKYYATNFAIAGASAITASLLSGFIGSTMRGVGGDVAIYSVFAVLLVAGLFVVALFARRYKKDLETIDEEIVDERTSSLTY